MNFSFIKDNDLVQKVETRGDFHIPDTVHQDVTQSADSKMEAPMQLAGVMKVFCSFYLGHDFTL